MPELKVVTPQESHLNVILHSFSRNLSNVLGWKCLSSSWHTFLNQSLVLCQLTVQMIWIMVYTGEIKSYMLASVLLNFENCSEIQWNFDNSKFKGPNNFIWIIETLNNWGLKCIHIFKLGLQNDFELLRILNYWSLNYRGSTVHVNKMHPSPTSTNC